VSSGEYGAVLASFRGDAGDLIPILQGIQGVSGFISEDAVRQVSRFLRVSENESSAWLPFMRSFRFTPPGGTQSEFVSAPHVMSGVDKS